MRDVNDTPPPQGTAETLDARGDLTLFGYPPAEVRVRLRPRGRGWRVGGAVRTQLLGLVAAPILGLVPPHAPWALGALGLGFFLARRRWRHHHTVEGVTGACPRCGHAVRVRPGMLRTPHVIPCEGCRFELSLVVDPDALQGDPNLR